MEDVQKGHFTDANLSLLKKGVWLYFYLLIFEGALRKWILPGLASPLLIVRDPIAIWLIFQAFRTSVWKPNISVIIVWGLTILALITALLVGHGNLIVALYGARITLLHFPLFFIIGNVFDKNDVLKMGKIILIINIGMTLLVAMQFYSPQSAWVNRGVGGDMSGSGFSGASDYFRVPGTFSFTNGLGLFYGLTATFLFYFWTDTSNLVSRNLLRISTVMFVIAVPLSISRSVFFETSIALLFLLLASGKNSRFLINIIGGAIAVLCLYFILSNFSFFQTATGAFTERFTSANKTEGGIEGVFVDRFLGGMYGAVSSDSATFFGAGLGMGTNAGAQLMTGNITFLISEGEWGRVIGEMGFLMGMVLIIVRTNFTLKLLKQSWNAVGQKNILPWMIMSFAMFSVLQGQWAQPTSLGFAVLAGGLVIAALKTRT